MKTLSYQDVRDLVGDSGTFFRVGFIKRKRPTRKDPSPSPEYREMTGRLGVKKHLKGGSRAYDFEEKNLLGVWIPEQDRRNDGKDQGYRVIPCENVRFVKAHGRTWEVKDGELREI